MRKLKARIIGHGYFVPEKVLTNFDLEKMVDTSNEWIVSRSGIRERRICSKEESSSTIGCAAAKLALENAGVTSDEIDMIIVSTLAADGLVPATACNLQHYLGATEAAAFDINGACTGYIYALAIASQFIETGRKKKILVVGAECCSKFVDWQDRETCVLFGDGAGALVLSADPDTGIDDIDMHSDASLADILTIPAGGSKLPATEETVKSRLHYIRMNGKEVYKAAIKLMGKSVSNIMERNKLTKDDIQCFIPHQANIRIIESLRKRLDLPVEKVLINVDKYGNTSSATIPIGICEAIDSGKINKGDRVLITGAGAGFTYGSIIFRY